MHVCVCDFYVHSFTFSVFVDRLSFVDLTNLRLISISMKKLVEKSFLFNCPFKSAFYCS